MNETRKTILIAALGVIVALLLFFSGRMMTGATLSGGMMGSGWTHGISWLWIPMLLTLGLGALLAWAIFGPAE